MAKLAAQNRFEAYCLPAGVMVQLFHAAATEDIVELVVRGKPHIPKFVERFRQITFSAKNARRTGQEVLYVTEAAVFRLTPEGVRLEEIAPGLDLERDILPRLGFRPPIKEPLGLMAPELFGEETLPAALFPQFDVCRG
jgi:acyl CoA:acetate/3-ketoacid CoA transferase